MGETMNLVLSRFKQDIVTFGKLEGLSQQPDIYSIERPWLDNKRGISCIPVGIYNFVSFLSPKHGWVWKSVCVPDRDDIETHVANYASEGVRKDGTPFHPDVDGCIGFGLGIEEDVPMITKSKDAIDYLRKTIGRNGFTLEVKNR